MIMGGKHRQETAAEIKPSISQDLQIKGLAMRPKRTESNPLGEENLYALDNFRGLGCVVATRARHILHDGRIYPHLIGPGGCYAPDPGHSGPEDDFLITEVKK